MFDVCPYATPHHARLNALVGTWTGTTRSRFEAEDEFTACPTTHRLRWIANRHFVLHEYDGMFGEEVAEGAVFYGYAEKEGVYTAAWVDSFHTGTAMMPAEGLGVDEAVLDLTSWYSAGEPGEEWGWRTVVTCPTPDRLEIRMFNLPPDSDPYLVVESLLMRASEPA